MSTTESAADIGPSASADDARAKDTQDVRNKDLLEELLKDVSDRPPLDLKSPELRYAPAGNADNLWEHAFQSINRHDTDLCKTHREQIDTLLVFAGLFSAVVTTFAAGSVQWLQNDPNETSAELLRAVVGLLAQNTTQPSALSSPPPIFGLPSAVSVRINVYWFLSLTLSLSAALIGILCKQWVREYERDAGQSREESVAVRQVKFEGFESWKVGGIVASVPLLLQTALALFFLGILELLWRLHIAVAASVTVVAGLTAVFYFLTTILPVCQYLYASVCSGPPKTLTLVRNRAVFRPPGDAFTSAQCPFKSPQAWTLLHICQPFIDRAMGIPMETSPPLRPTDSWVTFDQNWATRRDSHSRGATSSYRALAWLLANMRTLELVTMVWHRMWSHDLMNTTSTSTPSAKEVSFRNIVQMSSPPTADNPLAFMLPKLNGPWSISATSWMIRYSVLVLGSVDTAMELFLRFASEYGLNKREVHTSLVLISEYLDSPLSDDLAVALVRFIERSTWSADEVLRNRPWSLYRIVQILCRAPASSQWLVPSFCAVVLAKLRPLSRQDRLRAQLTNMASWLLFGIGECFDFEVGRSTRTRSRDPPGLELMLALAEFALELHPSPLDDDDDVLLEAREVVTRLFAMSSSPHIISAHASAGPQETGALPSARDNLAVSERLKSPSTPIPVKPARDPALGGPLLTELIQRARHDDAEQDDPVASRIAAPAPRPHVAIEISGADDARLDSTQSVAPPSESAAPTLSAVPGRGMGTASEPALDAMSDTGVDIGGPDERCDDEGGE